MASADTVLNGCRAEAEAEAGTRTGTEFETKSETASVSASESASVSASASESTDFSSLPYVDLHVHTWYSDSSYSPKEVIQEAVRNHVGLLAIADHELLAGSLEGEPLALKAGIQFLPAIELTGIFKDITFHILGYGIDRTNPDFVRLAASNRAILDKMSDDLVERLQSDYPALSLEDYNAFPFTRGMGGWKCLHYLKQRGVTHHLEDAFSLYVQYGVTYEAAGFPEVEVLIQAIHAAGGKAVLAHPGYTLRHHTPKERSSLLEQLLSLGLDGMECYYPKHTKEVTLELRYMCASRNLLITAGSDCHGTFEASRIGEMNIPLSSVHLGDLRPIQPI